MFQIDEVDCDESLLSNLNSILSLGNKFVPNLYYKEIDYFNDLLHDIDNSILDFNKRLFIYNKNKIKENSNKISFDQSKNSNHLFKNQNNNNNEIFKSKLNEVEAESKQIDNDFILNMFHKFKKKSIIDSNKLFLDKTTI